MEEGIDVRVAKTALADALDKVASARDTVRELDGEWHGGELGAALEQAAGTLARACEEVEAAYNATAGVRRLG